MKLLCVIDSLGSGGAQRQMVNLACGLKAKGHDVELFLYYPAENFFRSDLVVAGIPVHEVQKNKGFSFKVLGRLVSLMRSGKYKAVISFLHTPNIYVELAKVIARPRLTLVVSERSSYLRESDSLMHKVLRFMHVWADAVVANSYTHAEWLRKHAWLRHKSHQIYNGYPIPGPRELVRYYAGSRCLTLLIVGRIDAEVKNGVRLLDALLLFEKRNGYTPVVSWAGRQESDAKSIQVRDKMDMMLAENPRVSAHWTWLGERKDIALLLANCDALIHVSLYEGLPNAICEAFIVGRPVIASNVCDHPFLVEDGVRGVLCDPLSTESICAAIERLAAMSPTEREAMGQNARNYAEQYLTIDRMVAGYEDLIF